MMLASMQTRRLIAGLLYMLAGTLGGAIAQPICAQSSELDRLRTDWNSMVFSTLSEANAEISSASEGIIRSFLSDGIRRIAADGYSEPAARAATDGLRLFTSRLLIEGRRPDGTVRIGEETVDAARRWFCPLYPFC